MKNTIILICLFFLSSCSAGDIEKQIHVKTVIISGDNSLTSTPKQLTAVVLPSDAHNKELTWSVSDPTIAIITQTGLLTGVKNGVVTVTARAKDESGITTEKNYTVSGVTAVYATKVRSESILLWQRNNGGWGKAIPDLNRYNVEQTPEQKTAALASKNNTDTTIDNGHVVTELRWLLADYKTTQNPNYLAAAEKAIDWLFLAQYANGGWPQYYPDKSGYRYQITYNDGAIANVLNLMWDITKGKNNLELVNATYIPKAVTAFNKGIDIILQTQITYKGKKTVWCAQHDEVTLKPALARAYELPTFSGSESVGIVRVLMLVEQPSVAVKQAVKDAVDWFNGAKLLDITTKKISDASQPSGEDVVVVSSPGSVTWARFYDLENNLPLFCGRDGIPKKTLAEIENERRVGYSWYGSWPNGLIGSEYTNWKAKHGL